MNLHCFHKHLASLVRKMFGNTGTVRKNNNMKWSFLSNFSEIGLIFLTGLSLMNNLVFYTFSFVNSSTLICYKLGIIRVQLKQL